VSTYTKAALSVIRVIAAGLIVLSLCLCSPDLFLLLSHQPLDQPALLVLKAIPFGIGLVLYWKSDDLAKKWTQDLD
jgi:hypothetical protein